MPNKTLACAPQAGLKIDKKRITVAIICNVLGNEFINPIVIGHHKKWKNYNA